MTVCSARKIAAVALCAAVLAPGAGAQRTRERIDAGWRFHMEDETVTGRVPGGASITEWRVRDAGRRGDDAAEMSAPGLDTSGSEWRTARTGEDVFHGRRGWAWFRASLPAVTRSPRVLHFEGVDDNATVFLNGKQLARHEGWGEAFDVPLDSAWQAGGNMLAVLVENTDGPGGITGAVNIVAGEIPTPAPAKPGFSETGWRTVHLPHDYVVEGPFDPTADGSHGFRPVHPAWYRKTLVIPASARGKSVWIDFDGVYRDARVWLNGQLIGQHPCGYTSFRCDITKVAKYGAANTLVVRSDPSHPEGWWYEGGGIYRHVWFNTADPVHVKPWGTLVTSNVRNVLTNPSATLALRTTLANETGAPQTCTLVSRIVGPNGKTVATATSRQTVPANGEVDVRQTADVADAALWSVEKPQMYRMETVVQRNGKAVDTYYTNFGIRTLRYDAQKGFFLNEKPVKLKGTCNHQDYAGIGVAIPDAIFDWRVKRLQSMGSNAYRCSHNVVADELLDACDRLGMLVMDENRHLGDTESGKAAPTTPADRLDNLNMMVLRDRNHPSVIMWSICNEEGIQGSPDGARIARAMKTRIDELDGSRPVTAAMNGGHGSGISTVVDLEGFNYSPGAYVGYHNSHPDHPVFGSETGSTVSTRGIYANDRQKGYVSAYDVNAPPWAQTAEDAWQPVAENDWVFGSFCWTGFDYKGEPTPYGWPCINSHFGILDMCGYPKDIFYYYKAWWEPKPLVHITPHWNWPGKEGQPISVWAFGNTERVELFLNGKSLGAKPMPRYRHVEWSVPYEPGKLELRGYNGDTVAATDVVETAGAPAAIRLKTDRTVLMADGEDMTVVEVAIVDAQGRVVPTADNHVSFQTTGVGHVTGVGNGDASSHEPDKASDRSAFNGLCMALIGGAERTGDIRLTATAPGLKPATLTFRVK